MQINDIVYSDHHSGGKEDTESIYGVWLNEFADTGTSDSVCAKYAQKIN